MKKSIIGKVLLLVLTMMIAAALLAGCGSKDKGGGSDAGEKESVSVDSLKTIGDITKLDAEDVQTTVGNGKVVYAYKIGDTYYRSIADISKEDEKAYIDIDITQEDYEEKQNEIVAPLEITKTENLNEQMLGEEELGALKGKTGADLVKEGFSYNGSYDLDAMEFWLEKGPFVYSVKFDGKVKGGDSDDFDAEQATKELKVESAEFSQLGDAANIEE